MKKVIYATKHGIQRANERKNESTKKAKKLAGEAYLCGLRMTELDDRRRAFLQARKKDNAFPVVYRGYVYIFGVNGAFITLYKTPAWFTGKSRKTKDGYVRKYYKYYKYNLMYKSQKYYGEVA